MKRRLKENKKKELEMTASFNSHYMAGHAMLLPLKKGCVTNQRRVVVWQTRGEALRDNPNNGYEEDHANRLSKKMKALVFY